MFVCFAHPFTLDRRDRQRDPGAEISINFNWQRQLKTRDRQESGIWKMSSSHCDSTNRRGANVWAGM